MRHEIRVGDPLIRIESLRADVNGKRDMFPEQSHHAAIPNLTV